MRRFTRHLLLAAATLPILAGLAAGCGDGEDTDADATANADAPADGTPAEPTKVPDKPLPTPSPIPDDVPVIQVVSATKNFTPLRSEFAALPKVTVSAGGKTYEGVSLATLAAQAGAPATATATIQGPRNDNLRLGAIRFSVSEIGTTTVFVIDDTGHVLLASTSVPPEQWLKDVTGISLN